MLFNSVDFAFFMALVFTGYWFVFKKPGQQNLFLLAASYFFYACWDWRFLFLLLFSTALDYATDYSIFKAPQNLKKVWLTISIVVNLGFLFFFKYYNFFAESFAEAFTFFGQKISPATLSIVLPVGISFYTFHGLSYVIDIYKGRIEPERNFSTYALFVSYFPLLVAGPIERATHLLPQLLKPRSFNYELATDGLRQFLWGLFKKVVIANNCAHYADKIFIGGHPYNGSSMALGVFFFAIQIYADFSGYTDMASGVSKLLGIRLLRNFNYPYFATDIADFWRRWHISLSSWFRDYVYIPLGGSRVSILKQVRNVFIIFLLSGFWHGANSTYIVWGFVHACLFIPLLLASKNRASVGVVGIIADDDVVYLEGFDDKVAAGFNHFPDAVAIKFMAATFEGKPFQKYMKEPTDDLTPLQRLNSMSIELTFNMKLLRKSGVLFNTLFGLGSEFALGEEPILINRLYKSGYSIAHYPEFIVSHKAVKDSDKIPLYENYRIRGAYFYEIFKEKFPQWILLQLLYNLKSGKVKPWQVVICLKWANRGKQQLKSLYENNA